MLLSVYLDDPRTEFSHVKDKELYIEFFDLDSGNFYLNEDTFVVNQTDGKDLTLIFDNLLMNVYCIESIRPSRHHRYCFYDSMNGKSGVIVKPYEKVKELINQSKED